MACKGRPDAASGTRPASRLLGLFAFAASHSACVISMNPLPLQEFWPLQALLALLQAEWPLQEFTPFDISPCLHRRERWCTPRPRTSPRRPRPEQHWTVFVNSFVSSPSVGTLIAADCTPVPRDRRVSQRARRTMPRRRPVTQETGAESHWTGRCGPNRRPTPYGLQIAGSPPTVSGARRAAAPLANPLESRKPALRLPCAAPPSSR